MFRSEFWLTLWDFLRAVRSGLWMLLAMPYLMVLAGLSQVVKKPIPKLHTGIGLHANEIIKKMHRCMAEITIKLSEVEVEQAEDDDWEDEDAGHTAYVMIDPANLTRLAEIEHWLEENVGAPRYIVTPTFKSLRETGQTIGSAQRAGAVGSELTVRARVRFLTSSEATAFKLACG